MEAGCQPRPSLSKINQYEALVVIFQAQINGADSVDHATYLLCGGFYSVKARIKQPFDKTPPLFQQIRIIAHGRSPIRPRPGQV
jgi:hypothetical protein